MKAFVGITDSDWFSFLASRPGLDEVNFWQPSGATQFRALQPNELFLFKLHAPRHFIVGGALFAYSTILPLSLAWDAFQEKNGAVSLDEMRLRIARYRRVGAQPEKRVRDRLHPARAAFLPRRGRLDTGARRLALGDRATSIPFWTAAM